MRSIIRMNPCNGSTVKICGLKFASMFCYIIVIEERDFGKNITVNADPNTEKKENMSIIL